MKKFRNNKTNLPLYFLLSISIPLFGCIAADADSDSAAHAPLRDSLEVVDSFPAATAPLQAALFRLDRFELLGKLMTLLLKKDNKAYSIKPLRDSVFYLQSRNSIQKGSTIRMITLDSGVVVFSADLVVKKILQFPCRARAYSTYSRSNNFIICKTRVIYQAPALILDIDKGIKVVTGRKYIAYKIADFMTRIHKALTLLEQLDRKTWHEKVTDKKLLQSLYYPCTFTAEEIAFVAGLIKTQKKERKNN